MVELKLEFICLFVHSFIPQMFISPHYGTGALLGAGETALNRQISALMERTLVGGQKTCRQINDINSQ